MACNRRKIPAKYFGRTLQKTGTRVKRIARNVLICVGVILLAFAAGNLSGLYFYPRLLQEVDPHDDHAEAEDPGGPHDHEDEHLALTKQAFENLNLRMGMVERGDYWKSFTVPGEVIEIPGKSELSVSASHTPSLSSLPPSTMPLAPTAGASRWN